MRRVTGYLEYVTREGDTFDSLALQMYNEETLAHYIIEFNPEDAETPETLPPWRRGEEIPELDAS